jgi:superfamily II DNA or RNA helicase
VKLRPYQKDAHAATFSALGAHHSALLVMATGLGKTVVFARVAHDWPSRRVLVIAHREELVSQAVAKIRPLVPDVAVEMAGESSDERSAFRAKVVVASVQSLSRPQRLARFDPDQFGLVIPDEAHHAVAATWRRVIDHFRQNDDCRVLGVTATPRRADEAALGQVFETVAYDYGIEPAVADGWLVPVRQQAVRVEGLDFSKVRETAGDLNERDLEAIVAQEEVALKVVAPTVELAGDRPALVFAVTVKHAQMLAGILDRYRPKKAAFLSGQTDALTRRDTVQRFKDGQIQFLCNCGLFLEGFDAPTTALVVMARPTKSLPLYMQVIGRGTRPLPGVVDGEGLDTPALRRAAIAASAKPDMLVLDFVGNSGRHKIVTALDALGGKYGEAAREEARRNQSDESRPADVNEALERAAVEAQVRAEREERRRRAAVKPDAVFQADNVSPFQGGKAFSAPAPADPPTPGQLYVLIHKLGWDRDRAVRLRRPAAGAIIGRAKREGRC